MIIYKTPLFENDSYMFVINKEDTLAELSLFDLDYYSAKVEAFKTKNISKHKFSNFVFEKPSFRDFDAIENLSGTIYTYTCEAKNKLSYERIIDAVRNNYNISRRCAVNFADTLFDYLRVTKNTSCLNSIHYYKGNVTIYFRASDVENELLIDLHLIKKFFIDVVGNFETITVFASTAQNINNFKLENLCN